MCFAQEDVQMNIITSEILESYMAKDKRLFEAKLPELVKKLIRAETIPNNIRMPDNSDVWAPGFDGIIEVDSSTPHVCSGRSYWEIGTNKNYESKLESDYKKRTDETPEECRKKSILYLVTPHIWTKKKSISDWESEHTGWAKTVIYDGSCLIDWINSQPVVCAWLMSEFNEHRTDFFTVSDAWKEFEHLTNPALKASMFLTERDEARENLIATINTKDIIRIKSDCFYDSLGFVLTTIMSDPQLSESAVVVRDYQTYKIISNTVSNKIIILYFYCDDNLFHDNNHTIICYGKSSNGVKSDIQFPSLRRRHFESSLQEMGIEQINVSEIYRKTRGNLRALMRLFPGTSNNPRPEWTKEGNLSFLYPLLFLESIKRNGDHWLVESLANIEYEVIDEKYKELTRLEDTPVKLVGDYFVIINREEVWDALYPDPNDIYFQKLISTIVKLIDNSMSSDDYPRRGISLEQQLLSNLVWYSYSYSEAASYKSAVRSLLEMRACYYKIYDNLHVLAEADPEQVLDAICDDAEDRNSYIYHAFRNNKYTSILMAIDELMVHESTVHRACDILRLLDKEDINYFFSNNPRSSLSTALSLVNMYSALSIDEKVKILKSIIDDDPIAGTGFVVNVLEARSFYRYERIGRKNDEVHETLTYGKYYSAVYDLAEYVIKNCNESGFIKPIIQLTAYYWLFHPVKFSNLNKVFICGCYKDADVVELNYSLRKRVNYHDDKEDDKYVEPFDLWIKSTVLDDPLLSKVWIFKDYYHCPEVSLRDCFPGLDNDKTFNFRVSAMSDICLVCGPEKAASVVSYMDNNYNWGRIICGVGNKKYVRSVFDKALVEEKYLIVSGCLDSISKEDFFSYYNSCADNTKKKILPMISRRDIVDSLSEEELIVYWSNKLMHNYTEDEYSYLLMFNPFGLLYYCNTESEKNAEQIIECVIEVFTAIVDMGKDAKCNRAFSDLIPSIISRIDNVFYSEDWAKLCIKLKDMNLIEVNSEGINHYYYDNPRMLLEIMKESFGMFVPFRFPEYAFTNYRLFKNFCFFFIEEERLLYIGKIIGYTFRNDAFPPFVLDFLEEYGSYDFDKLIADCIVSNNGFSWNSDGFEQNKKAKKYEQLAQSLSSMYIHGKTVLLELKRIYANEAIREDIYGEIN